VLPDGERHVGDERGQAAQDGDAGEGITYEVDHEGLPRSANASWMMTIICGDWRAVDRQRSQ
jgi:hypothetical protein